MQLLKCCLCFTLIEIIVNMCSTEINPNMTFRNRFSLALFLFVLPVISFSQVKQVKFDLNDDGSHYVRFTGLNQVWVRYTDMNPGTTVFGEPVDQMMDIGIRRLRFQAFGQLTDRVFFYSQFGQNNFSFLQPRFVGAFFHDALTEFRVHENILSLGGGLTAWGGYLRYSSPSIGTIMSLDAPLYQQATANVSDQFLRKLSVYGKGQIGPLDYRVAMSKPLAVQNANINSVGPDANYNTEVPAFQYHGYFKFQLLDQEGNLTPYAPGAYLGKKRILAVGGGFLQQSDATWNTNTAGDTIRHDLLMLGIDVFYDSPIAEGKLVLTLYGAYGYTDFGPRYLRNVGVMNPANGINASGTINGAGNGFPMIGTGNTYYAQAGLAFGENILTEGGKLQPYAAAQYSDLRALNEPMLMAEGGVNWYIHGAHGSKISLNYQSRPVFESNADGNAVETGRKGMVQLQYQIAF